MDNPLVLPDPGLYFWTIATFLVLVFLLAKFAWRPLLDALERRQEAIRKSLDDAESARSELERLKTESAEILKGARVEAAAVVSKSRADALQLGEELKQKARGEADAIVREAKRQIESEKSQALREIRDEIADLSIRIASKLIERNISREDNERLVEETLERLEAGQR